MFELITIGLIVAVIVLWSRLTQTRRELDQLGDRVDQSLYQAQDAPQKDEATAFDRPEEPASPQPKPTPEMLAAARLEAEGAVVPARAPTPPPASSSSQAATLPDADPKPQSAPDVPREEPAQPPAVAAYRMADSPAQKTEAGGEPGAPASEEPPPTQEAPADAPLPSHEEAVEDEAGYEEPDRSGFDFEDIFGRRLPIWAGGITLAIAGIFLVRYAIEAGVFTPTFRVISSFIFGFALLGLAELAYRQEHRVADPRVRQALAGAGLATLFGAFYLAGTGYGLIGPAFAFVGLAGVTAAAIALSFRFGLPSAVIGLVGGYAAPVMVQSESANVPLLSLYLALVTGGLAWTGARQGHRWMGYVALAIGLGWGVLIQLAGLGGNGDALAIGAYLVVLGSVLPAFLYDRKGPGVFQIVAAGFATLQMAMLVANGGFEPLTWALYLLIAAALAGLGWFYPRLRLANTIAGFIGFWLLSLWPDAPSGHVLAVTAAMAAIFLGPPLVYQWRGKAGLIDIGQIALGALGLGAALAYQLGFVPAERSITDSALAAMLGVLAAFPIGAFALEWRDNDELEPARNFPLMGASYLLVFSALLLITPDWLAPAMAGILALIVTCLLWRKEAIVLRIAAWAGIAISILTLMVSPGFEAELLQLGDAGQLLGRTEQHSPLYGLIRWASLLPALIAMGIVRQQGFSHQVADGLATFIAYGAIAQIAPPNTLPAIAALGTGALFLWRSRRFAAWIVLFAIACLWALGPVIMWLGAGVAALADFPFMVTSAIAPLDLTTRLLPAGAVASLIALRGKDFDLSVRYLLALFPASLAVIALHSLYKQIFAIASLFQFEHLGMGERTIWQWLLLLAGFALSQWDGRQAAAKIKRVASTLLIGISLAYFGWFTLLLHNPLLSPQLVGPTPIANWLLPAYGGALVAIVLVRPALCDLWDKARLACDGAIMGLIAFMSVSLMRQIFSGSDLTAHAIGSTENLLLSLLGIALAIGFLLWGSHKNQRSWRVGSLVFMLMAVFKVFLFDAAGLEGLLRIASFVALGFSLIGTGWLYSRQLKRRPAEAASAEA